jgi:DNA-binding Xre family transcriptional regulator
MSRADLRKATGLPPNTTTKLRRDEPAMLNVLDKICDTIVSIYGDVMDYVPDDDRSDKA